MPSSPTPKFNTLTTAGRLAKAAHARAEKTPPAPRSPPPPKKKKKKTTVLPPPAELEAEANRRAEAKLKPKPKKPKKLLTTQDKIAASATGRKKKQAVVSGGQDGEGSRNVGGGAGRVKGGPSGTSQSEKPRNLMDIMREMGQMSSGAPTPASSAVAGKVQTVSGNGRGGGRKSKTKVKESVLVRPTERTKRMRQSQLHRAGASTDSPPAAIKSEDDSEPRGPRAGIMDLSVEVRQRIWRLVVVETHFFVYPAIDQEQPDLAMTSRQIRSEVLPLYYGENTFAVEIPVSTGIGLEKKKARGSERVSLEPVKKWMAVMADKEYVQTISKWAFSWAPPPTDAGVGTGEAGDREAIVSIRYPESAKGKDAQLDVEIHRQAFCLLENHKQFRPCFCKYYPRWLDDAVATAVLTEQDRGKQILSIAKDVEKRGDELVGSRCSDEVLELD